MRKTILLSLSLILLLSSKANADKMPFSDPDIPNEEKLIYREKEKDSWRTFTDTIKKGQKNGENVYIINSLGEEKINMLLKASTMKPIIVDSTCKYKEGMFRFKKEYQEKEVDIVIPKTKRDKPIKIPKNTYDEESLFYVLRGLVFEINKKVEFNLLYTKFDKIGMVSMYATIINKEKIIVPAGEFICYKVEMGLTGIEALLYKEKYCFWFNVQKPHYLVKYSSTEGEVIELINCLISP